MNTFIYRRTTRFVPLVLIMTLVIGPAAWAEISPTTGAEEEAWKMYSEGLELLLDEEEDQALEVFEALVARYPRSEAAEKARDYLEIYSMKLDRSGIVTFYLGNLLTTTWAAYSLPLILEIENGIILGTTGIIGVGTGIYTSWLMSRDIDMSLGQDLWIEFIEAAAVANFQYAYALFGDEIEDTSLREKINIGGQTFTSLGSRGITYLKVRDLRPSDGRAFTVINSYAWSQFYLWLTLGMVFESHNEELNYSLAIILPDLAAWGTYYLWEKAGWSFQRTGLISVSGLGGALTGLFTDMIVTELFDIDSDATLTASLMMGFSLAGKIIGVMATSGMEADAQADESLFHNLSFAPVISPEGTGIMMNLRY